jgi:glycosyltransferase involved in cell wall biosynthesis
MTSEGEKYNIICLSNQLWEYPLWTNKKHVMYRLSKLGHKVLFVDPPINTGRLLLRYIIKGNWSVFRLLTWQYKDENVRVITPLNFAPFFVLLSKLHSWLIQQVAKRYLEPDRKTILWVYHVEIAGIENYLNTIKHDLLIYDCVDNYTALPSYTLQTKRERTIWQENYLTERADIVFTTAPGLYERLKKLNPNTHYTPNVGDYEKFVKAEDFKENLPEDIAEISRPRVVFVGAADEYKFDRELFAKIVEDYPKYSFVVIGPIALKDREATKEELGFGGVENVYFLGTRPYSEVHKYFAGADVFIIPYQLNEYTVGGCFPVKFHDALAAGLPVVVTNLPAYEPFRDVSYISRNYEGFSQNIRRALEEDSTDKVNERRKVAGDNTWEKKVAKMLELIREGW